MSSALFRVKLGEFVVSIGTSAVLVVLDGVGVRYFGLLAADTSAAGRVMVSVILLVSSGVGPLLSALSVDVIEMIDLLILLLSLIDSLATVLFVFFGACFFPDAFFPRVFPADRVAGPLLFVSRAFLIDFSLPALSEGLGLEDFRRLLMTVFHLGSVMRVSWVSVLLALFPARSTLVFLLGSWSACLILLCVPVSLASRLFGC